MEKNVRIMLWVTTGKEKTIKKNKHLECVCACGLTKFVRKSSYGKDSFGCKSCTSTAWKHGESRKTRLYNIWSAMKQRCYYKKHISPNYRKYKIKVCDDWINNFVSFRDWALSNGYADNLSIDRIDNLGNYSPENCRWADANTQNKNKSSNIVWFEYEGEKMCLKDWCRRFNINYDTTRNRIYRGKTIAQALGLK